MSCRSVHRMACWAVRLHRVIKLQSSAVRWLNYRDIRRVVNCGRAVTCGRAIACGRAITCGRAVTCSRAITCRAVHHWCRDLNFWGWFKMNLPGRRRDHSDSSLLWRLDDLGRQLHFPSGDVRMSGPIGALLSSLMMTGGWLTVGKCPRWSWWQGSLITRRLMMTMMRGRGRRTGVRRLGNTAGLGTSPGAGPARGTWTGPLVLSPSTVTPRRMVSGGVLSFVGPVSSLPVHTSRPTGSPTRGSWAVLPQKPQTSVHRTQNSWLWSWSVLPWMTRCCWPVWKGVVVSLQEHGFRRNLAFFPAAAALCRVFWALAFAWAAQASGSQSVQTRQGLSWVQSGCPSFKRHCWQRKWLSFLLRKWEYPGNLGWDSAEDDRSCDRSTILSMQVRLDKEVNMASHANLLAQRSTWDQLISLHGQPKLSSFFVFDKRLGRPLGQCVNWTHVRSRARRKSKWTIGGCGALRKCGCAWTDKGTQFLCVKFRLGSAGKPTICSHCYDVLNEEGNYTVSHQHTKPFPKS